jgi:hypothetical protein
MSVQTETESCDAKRRTEEMMTCGCPHMSIVKSRLANTNNKMFCKLLMKWKCDNLKKIYRVNVITLLVIPKT